MAKKHTNVTAPIKGLWMDSPKNVQPEGTYTYALNAMSVSNEGEEGIISNECGADRKFSIDSAYYLLGHLALPDGYTVLLSLVEPDGRGFGSFSEIGLQTPEGNYTQVLRSSDLDFSKYFQIQIEMAMLDSCDRVIYFNTPTPYAINIDNLEQYLLDGYTVTTANADGDGWDIGLMKLFSEYTGARITDITVQDTGGNLPIGTYFAVIQYMDAAGNGTGWMNFTNAIPIVDESLGTSFGNIDGGLNSVSPSSSKSVSISIENLDVNYPYYQVGVIASNDDVRTGYLFEAYPLTASTSTYIIASLDNAEEVPITSFTVERAVYGTVETLTQQDSRLILGNVTERRIDHAAFQQAVNNYKTSWYVRKHTAEDMVSQESYKSPEAFFEFRGHPRDEVIALGVRFRFKDGYISPVYHIPGRELNTGTTGYFAGNVLPANYEINIHNRLQPIDGWDSTLYTVTTSDTPSSTEVYLSNVDFLGFTADNFTTFDVGDGPGVVARWRFCNTGIITENADDEESYAEGEMAYWESTLSYPDSLDCNGERVFPEGAIRHHKLPDATLIGISSVEQDVEYIYPLGIKVFDIDIPTGYSDEIDGVQIVRVKRDTTNSSVIDSGLFSRVSMHYYDSGAITLHQPGVYNSIIRDGGETIEETPYAIGIHTPKLKFFKDRVSASYIKYDKVVYDLVTYNLEDPGAGPGRYASSANFNTPSPIAHAPYGLLSLNRQILTQAYVDADTQLPNVIDINGTIYDFDNTEQQEVFVASLVHKGTGPRTGIEDDTPSTCNDYYLGGKINNTYFYSGTVKRYLPQQYGNISSLLYIPLTADFQDVTSSITTYGGDCFISKLYTRRTYLEGTDEPYDPANHDENIDTLYRAIWGFYCESQVNCGYRHAGEEPSEVYYPKETLFTVQMIERYTSDDPTNIDNEYLDLIPNYYAINKDFLQENSWKVYTPLPSNFDYCDDCEGHYHTRMPYSEVKSNEGTVDSYKLFLSNNYRDLPANTGDITNLFTTDGKLYAHTTSQLWFVPTSPQQFNSSENTIYVGTGEFMSITPVPVKYIKGGYLGSTQKFATLQTEYGTFFLSADRAFLLTANGLEEISRSGMRQFFMDNTIQYSKDVYDLTGVHFTETDNTASGCLVGYIAAYDPRKHRLILHKKDYKILSAFEDLYVGLKDSTADYEVGSIVYDEEKQVFQTINSKVVLITGFRYTYTDVSLENTEYFENKSYTLSYDLQNKHWISFHSYLPNYMYNTANRLYSFINDDEYVYCHDSLTHQRFYSTKYDHIIEFTITDTPLLANVAKSIGYISKTKEYEAISGQQKINKNRTFTDVWVYNDSQSSGKLAINIPANPYNPTDILAYSPTSIRVENKEGVWKFNGFRNYVPIDNSVAIATSSWNDIQDSYPIDKLPFDLSLDTDKPQYELDKFRDMYVSVRLYNTMSDDQNYSLITQYIYSNAKYSNR